MPHKILFEHNGLQAFHLRPSPLMDMRFGVLCLINYLWYAFKRRMLHYFSAARDFIISPNICQGVFSYPYASLLADFVMESSLFVFNVSI